MSADPESATPRPDGVVFLHGIARRASSLRRLERAFEAEGFATLNLDYPARRSALAELAETIAPAVNAFAGKIARLHIVTHSMGGLVARALITRHRPANLGRVVMLAPPNAGSEVADRLFRLQPYRRFFGPAGAELVTNQGAELRGLLGNVDYPLGIIAGDRSVYLLESTLILKGANDGRVTVARTRCPGMTDHITLHTTHATMMWNSRVMREALHFIRHERFSHDRAVGPDRGPA